MRSAMISLGSLLLALALGIGGCQKPGARDQGKQGTMKAGGQSLPSKHAGKPFTLKQATSLDELLAKPKAFAGKTVRVKGLVVQHCHHKKTWFALAKAKGSKQKLQVQTKPAFLVPANVKNGETRAEAEGVVEMRTVPEKRAKHLAHEHGLFGGDPAKITGPQYLPRLKATGARFQ